ncbi:MAG: hypothetical protein C0504_09420 [Candidatus Solibacter sp.]|nr:hypothetical protein [Candidatus Solibacter sp.]
MTVHRETIEKRWPIVLFAILGVALAVRLFLYIGYQGADDRNYVAYAVNFAQGGDIAAKGLADPWIARLGAWMPMGLLIKGFGAHEWVLTAYSLACSLAGIALAVLALRQLFDTRLALMTAALLAVYPNDVFYSTRAFADQAVGFWCALAFLLYLIADRNQSWRLFLLTGLALGVAYLTKETAVLLLAPIAILWWIKRPPGPRMLVWMACGFLIVLALELAIWQSLAGDPLYRWKAATGAREALFPVKEYRTLLDYIPGPLPHEVFRSNNSLLEAALMFMTNEEFGFLFYFVFPISIWAIVRGHASALPLALLVVCLTLLQLFFPLQFPTYTLNRDPRYYTPLSIAALALLAWWTMRLKPRIRAGALGFIVATWMPCLYIGYVSSDMSLQREAARFAGGEADRTVWMTNRMAADVIVLAENARSLRIGVHWIGANAPADDKRLANSAIRAMRPSTPAVRDADGVRGGYVMLDGRDKTPLPESWERVREFRPAAGRLQIIGQTFLKAVHAPQRFVDLLAPSHSASAVLYLAE